ncbi:MAG TPA: hypothetical protein VGC79_27160 [Polyangiaceae bacterium]
MDTRRLMLLSAVCVSLAGTAAADAPQQVGDCASVSASARPKAIGYTHVVTLSNACQRTVACEVWTDVDPSPHYTLQAKPGKSAEVITRNGSPASEVHADKRCHFTL